ncbi:MFS transporter [candidate division KSB1 bacterium]|nr:MFS transporter [candidate division KSB1 bacterium]
MYDKKRVFLSSCLAMLIFGIVMTFLGAILAPLIDHYRLSDSQAGFIVSLLSVGMLCGSLFFGPIVDRQGYKPMLLLSVALIFLSLLAVSWIDAVWVLGLAIFSIGLGGGVLNGGSNALVADISLEGKSSNLSFLGIFFGLGAFGVPFLRGVLPADLSYRIPLTFLATLTLLPLIFFVFISFPQPKQEQGFPLRQGISLLKSSTLIVLGMVLFFESGIEFTLNNWAPRFLIDVLNLPENKATLYFSINLLGIMFSRLFLGYYLKGRDAAKTLLIFFVISLCGTVLLLLSTQAALTVVGLFVLGIGIASVYPIILAFIGEHFPSFSGTAIGMAMVMALCGGALFPYLTGLISAHSNLKTSFLLIPVAIVLQIILFGLYRGHQKR